MQNEFRPRKSRKIGYKIIMVKLIL
uniref:Uncharacterized protein n=1 Tax=Arundo donax TaxID=35708 RepID=A0A0A9EVF2_ARUDO